jgi:hypothetical protein
MIINRMSSNQLIVSEPSKDIQAQRNCLNVDGKQKLNFRDFTKTYDDTCYVATQAKQSMGPGKYQVSNHYHCDCRIPDVVENASSTLQTYFKNGYGVAGCVVEESSALRLGKTKRYPKSRTQLFERPYLTVPLMARGSGDTVVETQLLPGEQTKERRQCNSLSGVTIDNYFTPLIDHLRDNVQDPSHIIPEHVQDGWIRGGSNTRLIVRDVDYLERCGYGYMNKTNAGQFWESKHKQL